MDPSPAGGGQEMAQFLKGVAATLPTRPQAIVLVSGHWQAPDFTVTASAQPGLMDERHGFAPHTHELSCPVSGAPALAARIAARLAEAGLPGGLDEDRGLDHGVFVPLQLMFPAADIPVVQLSLRVGLDPQAHLAAGAALVDLRAEGVLIVGSGLGFAHMRGDGEAGHTAPSEAFDDWLTVVLQAWPRPRSDALRRWSRAPCAIDCHPAGQEQHLMPLLVAAGAAGQDRGRKVYSRRVLKTRLSAFRFG